MGMPSIPERLATLEREMIEVQKGVSNFRSFQERGNKFFDSAEAVWKSDSRRRARNLAIWVALLGVLTPGLWRGIHWATSTIDTVLEIEKEWKSAHPSEFAPQKSFYSDPDPQRASNQIQADKW